MFVCITNVCADGKSFWCSAVGSIFIQHTRNHSYYLTIDKWTATGNRLGVNQLNISSVSNYINEMELVFDWKCIDSFGDLIEAIYLDGYFLRIIYEYRDSPLTSTELRKMKWNEKFEPVHFSLLPLPPSLSMLSTINITGGKQKPIRVFNTKYSE